MNSPSGNRMMEYLPPYWHEVSEMKEILETEGVELDDLIPKGRQVLLDAFIMTASESRISEWERWLKLSPSGTLDERRMQILRNFSVISKLSDDSIKALVKSLYDGARALNQFDDSEIKITVVPLPENFMDDLDLSILLEQLEYRKPCHIGVSAERAYSCWQDIYDNFDTWGDVKNTFKSWEEVLMYIPR